MKLEKSRTKKQPKEEVFGTDIPRTSGGHSRGYPGPKLRSGRSKSLKNLGADIHDPKARMSTTLRDFPKLRSEKLWAEFSFPKKGRRDQTPRPPSLIRCGRKLWEGKHAGPLIGPNANEVKGDGLALSRRVHINFPCRSMGHWANSFQCSL